MRFIFTLVIAVVGLLLLPATVGAQPILNRVEKLLREQLADPAADSAERAEPGYLGLVADEADAPGVRVIDVAASGPAALAGIQPGDLLKSVDGQSLRSVDDLARALEGKKVGAKLNFNLQRGSSEQKKIVTLGRKRAAARGAEELPGPALPPPDPIMNQGRRLGVRTVNVSDDAARQNKLASAKGAVVISVAPGSPAALAGIPVGAIITDLDGQPVASPNELADAIRQLATSEVELTYYHQGQKIRQRISLDESADVKSPSSDKPAAPPIPDSELPQQSELPPAVASRIEALESRIAELEQKIKSLEARVPPAPMP